MARINKKIRGTLLLDNSLSSIGKAAEILKAGGLVAFPTETVYGLGARATDPAAVKKIFTVKGRPADNPLIVHLASPRQLDDVALEIPPEAELLAKRFWPGPLSLVLKRSKLIAPEVSAGLQTVAVRMPAHPTALKLIKAVGDPLAAPSANLAGRPSPTSYQHVLNDLSGKIDAVIKATHCRIGVESTVLDLTVDQPVILRPGGVPREDLEEALNRQIMVAGTKHKPDSPSSPGMKYRHYAPSAPLILITGEPDRRKQLIASLAESFRRQGFKVGLLNKKMDLVYGEKEQCAKMAATLYNRLRLLDLRAVDLILAEETGNDGLGLAVMNRLRKAAFRILKV